MIKRIYNIVRRFHFPTQFYVFYKNVNGKIKYFIIIAILLALKHYYIPQYEYSMVAFTLKKIIVGKS